MKKVIFESSDGSHLFVSDRRPLEIVTQTVVEIGAASSLVEVTNIVKSFPQRIDALALDYWDADGACEDLEISLKSRLKSKRPNDRKFRRAHAELGVVARRYLSDRIFSNVRDNHVIETRIEMDRLLDQIARRSSELPRHYSRKYLVEAVNTVIDDCETEIELLRRKAKLYDEIAVPNDENKKGTTGEDKYDPEKRGLSRQLGMLLMDELFPEFRKASKKARSEFLALLTGYSSEGLRQKWTDYERGNKPSLDQDQKQVEFWRKKLDILGKEKK